MQFQKRDENVVSIYQCGVCDKFYEPQMGMNRVSCLVAHGPGSCCHYNERKIDRVCVDSIKAMIEQFKRTY